MPNVDQTKLFTQLDEIPQLKGVGVAYIGENACTLLRASRHVSGVSTFVIIEESADASAGQLSSVPAATRSRIWPEMLGLGLSCGGVVVSGIVVTGAATVTAGTSTLLLAPIIVGGFASAVQCGVSINRVFNELTDPTQNDYLDSETWYQNANNILDALSLLGAAASVSQSVKLVLKLKAASGRPFREILKGMDRTERKRLAKDLARYQSEAGSNKELKALIRAGAFPKVISQTAVTQALKLQLRDAVANAMSVGSSADTGLIKKSIVVHLFQEE